MYYKETILFSVQYTKKASYLNMCDTAVYISSDLS